MEITYSDSAEIKSEDLSRLFMTSGIKRPYQDLERLARMIEHADIIITAWHAGKMIGIARALTDYSYCCYLSDLAVDAEYQKSGIGNELVDRVKDRIGEECSLVLISAPGATEYYPKIGFVQSDKAFVIARQR
jgi:N-acetylglutamate synthase-like GNAT family acetyltransferase